MRLSIESYERMAGEVLKVYEQAEIEMLRRVTNRLKRGVDQPGWTEKHYGEMKAVSAEMTKVVDELHNGVNRMQQEYVDTAYADGKDSFINEAKQFTDLSGITHLTPNAIKVANIMGDLDMSMNAADRLILRQVNDAYANIIAETAGLVSTGSYTNRQAVQTAVNRFADKGITSFVDKAGRHWDMTTYAEMATLTAIERATRQGYTDTMQEYGFDLAIISSHYGACPLCEAWENVIISISGRDARYPSLADAEGGGCFHPRCLHDFNTYFEGITEGGRKGPKEVITENVGYAARAQLRAYERSERQWKRRMAVAQTPEEERAAYARVRMYQDRIRTLVNDYNSTQPQSVDYLHRQWYREGGRVKLSTNAAKLKPVQIPKGQQAAPVSLAKAESELLSRSAKDTEKTLKARVQELRQSKTEFSPNDYIEAGKLVLNEIERSIGTELKELNRKLEEIDKERDMLKETLAAQRLEAKKKREAKILSSSEYREVVNQIESSDIAERNRRLMGESFNIRDNIDKKWHESLLEQMKGVVAFGDYTKEDIVSMFVTSTRFTEGAEGVYNGAKYYPKTWTERLLGKAYKIDARKIDGRGYSSRGIEASVVNGKPIAAKFRTDGGLDTSIHEYGHLLEFDNPKVNKAAMDFFLSRAGDDKPEKLSTLKHDSSYRSDEIAIKDHYIDPYMGKDYRNTDGSKRFDTELISMGYEKLYTDRYSYFDKDEDMRDWLIGLAVVEE